MKLKHSVPAAVRPKEFKKGPFNIKFFHQHLFFSPKSEVFFLFFEGRKKGKVETIILRKKYQK